MSKLLPYETIVKAHEGDPDAGLRGFCVGGAQVSEKHCGFVINTGDATAADIVGLIREIQRRVEEQFGVKLEPEVRFLGEF